MIIARLLFTTVILLYSVIANAYTSDMHIDNDLDDLTITTDNRIKTYIHNPNEVYLLVLHFGFQSSIEFAKNEEIQNIVLGESYA